LPEVSAREGISRVSRSFSSSTDSIETMAAMAGEATMRRPNRRLLWSAAVAALGGFLFGFDTAVISGATEALRLRFALDSNQLGFTVASALLGTIAGSIAAGPPSERYGRRPVLRALAVLYFLSAAGCGLASNWLVLLSSRFVGGLAIGASSVVAPMYIAEISPAALRGRLVGLSQFNVVSGILAAYFSNYLIAVVVGGPETPAWRWMLGIPAVPAAIFFALLLGIAESPRWLVKQHRRDEAADVLRAMGNEQPEVLVREIAESLHEESVSTSERFFQRKYLKPILLAIMVASFNQLAGINAVIYYTADIFAMAGAERASALLQSVIIGFTNLVFTMIGMTVIDRFGRRRLLLIGAVGLAGCLTLTAWAFHRGIGGRLVLASLLGYIAFFAFSQGAVIWVYISEIFPNRVRARGQALGSFTHWFWAAVVSWSFPVIADASGASAFAFFAVMMVLQFVLVWRFLPETKGVSLEQIQRKLGIE
jgi:sugar porter (SP) family MFS transporter